MEECIKLIIGGDEEQKSTFPLYLLFLLFIKDLYAGDKVLCYAEEMEK